MNEYIVTDAIEWLNNNQNSAHLIHLDDAWARPHRNGAFGVDYDTHGLETTITVLNACQNALVDGGWLIADGDDWFTPRLIQVLQQEWGDVASTYQGGGFRRLGSVTYLTKDGQPDRSTNGMYTTNGGYSVVFAHNGETKRRSSVSARQIAQKPRNVDYPSAKPIAPYENWIEGLTSTDETVVVPMAGSAPAAIAAEKLNRKWIAIDTNAKAKTAWKNRRCETNESLSSY